MSYQSMDAIETALESSMRARNSNLEAAVAATKLASKWYLGKRERATWAEVAARHGRAAKTFDGVIEKYRDMLDTSKTKD